MDEPESRGGSFLLFETQKEQVFTPEEFSEEQELIARTTEEFVFREVLPALGKIEQQKFTETVRLLRQAGALGLLGADIPKEYGGLAIDKITSALISEKLALGRSFALSFGAHVGIGTLPIVFFGTKAQKAKYLPALATGEKLAAYALTEAGSGSDALAAKTTAILSECGTFYCLSGEKQWITNAGFADIFIVYAKVDGEHFTAFIVEKGFEGVSTGQEEEKMGIKGSSTRTLILDEARVPKENVLGELGKGHRIAFNILNIGRYKLAVGCLGSCKRALQLAVQYAKQRKQFQVPIAQFNLIKSKLANMALRIYVQESMVYRTAGLFEQKLGSLSELSLEDGQQVGQAIAEYAIECSINKVYGSETLDFVVDEAVQIHGGYGYMSEYEVENIYRDSRINRIFEGTNEINRLLITDTLLRKALKGELPFMAAAQGLQEELFMYLPVEKDGEALAQEKEYLQISKKLFLLVAGTALRIFQQNLGQEQELLAHLADMTIDIYALESALLRTEKALERDGLEQTPLYQRYTQVYAQEALQRMESRAREALAAMEEGDGLRILLAIVRKLTRHQPLNTIVLKRSIAEQIIHAERYIV